ncbi:MAG: hypothetical protein JWL95_2923, partial [Gemmatimonadetes bacterium]|nr:hypothetical protein [Gemmatimonadota bacterium]
MTSALADVDPAWALALACARHAAGITSASAVEMAARGVDDWPRALDVARAQGLGALLARALRDADAPAPIQDTVRDTITA